MRTLTALALGTALTLSMPLAATAQDAEVDGTLDTELTTEMDDAEVGVETDETVDADAAAADAEMDGRDLDLSEITEDTRIGVFGLTEVADEGTANRDDYTVEHQLTESEDTDAMREQIAGNSFMADALEEAGYSVEDVVTIWSQADGSFDIIVDDSVNADAEMDADAEAGEMDEEEPAAE